MPAGRLGLETVPVHVAKDLSPEQARALRIAANKTGELSGWDGQWPPTLVRSLSTFVSAGLGSLTLPRPAPLALD